MGTCSQILGPAWLQPAAAYASKCCIYVILGASGSFSLPPVPKRCPFGVILSPKVTKKCRFRHHFGDLLVTRWIYENMRLDRAGSIGLHVGPVRLGSKNDKTWRKSVPYSRRCFLRDFSLKSEANGIPKVPQSCPRRSMGLQWHPETLPESIRNRLFFRSGASDLLLLVPRVPAGRYWTQMDPQNHPKWITNSSVKGCSKILVLPF